MGIQGLLQFIKDASEPMHIKKYKGQTVAVDTYCWLHKGAFSCAERLAKGEPTDQYVTYCMKFVDMLLSFGVKPILVFDGCNLPSKQEVEKARRERRQANLQRGKQLLREGKLAEARECFTRCVNVTHSMAHEVIKAARGRGVDCVVAPYEADAQLAFLNKADIAQAVITEDSDLLAFGCKKVVLKMDKQGNGLEIDQNNLGRCRLLGNVFTEEKFRHMCILSGCDYLASLYGIGLGKACKLLRMANNPDILKVIRKIGQYLKMNITVPNEYLDGFVKADNTFLYQLVFDPLTRKVVPLNPYPPEIDPTALNYAGVNVGDKKALQMALGNIDVNTMEQIDNFNPDNTTSQPSKPRSQSWSETPDHRMLQQTSIWKRGYVPGLTAAAKASMVPTSPERPPPTRGKERVVSVRGLNLSHKEPQVKRPRQDSNISEDDLMQQYSAAESEQKRHCSGTSLVTSSPSPTQAGNTKENRAPPEPKARNRFATLLQKRNHVDDGQEQHHGTLSRFFHSSSQHASLDCPTSPTGTQNRSSETPSKEPRPKHQERPIQNSPKTETESVQLVCEESNSPTGSPGANESTSRPASQGLGVFSWSASSATSLSHASGKTLSSLATLQQFQRKKETWAWTGSRASVGGIIQGQSAHRRATCDSDEEKEEKEQQRGAKSSDREQESSPDSPPSQDSAYFSQPSSAYSSLDATPTTSFMSLLDVSTPAEETSSALSPDGSPIDSSYVEDLKSTPKRPKVAGLPRPHHSEKGKGGKIRTSAPARASGLRKKPPGSSKKSGNDENQPGVQTTISSLWRSFGYKKEITKITVCKKGEPMSPVKENVPTSC